MKRYFLLFVISFFIQLLATGQNVHRQPNFVLNQPVTGNETYEARDYIDFTAGFEYTPQATTDQFTGTINPYLVFPPEGGITGGPNSGDDGVVGAINGILNVSPSGAATYSVPIDVPPGIAGVQPDIALMYNSQGGDGIMGPGWAITGISEISIVSGTIYHDKTDSPNYLLPTAFALDGNRLIFQKDSTDNDGYSIKKYRLEKDNFSIIYFYYKKNDISDSYFKVRYSDGSLGLYGTTSDSKLFVGTLYRAPTRYYIAKKYDIKSNYIDYNYYTHYLDGECLIQQINYTCKGLYNITGNKIIFEYEDREDPMIAQFGIDLNANLKHKIKHRLIKIQCLHGNEILKEYELTYITQGPVGIHYLNKIKKKSNNIKCNPTILNWESEPDYNQYIVDNSNLLINDGGEIYPLDYNGDGKEEMMVLYKDQNLITFHKLFPSGEFVSEYFSLSNIKSTNVRTGDFNGDGKSDILYWYKEDNKLKVGVYYANGTYFTNHDDIIEEDIVNNPDCIVYIGDFDGNGIADCMLNGGLYISTYLGQPNNSFIKDINYNNYQNSLGVDDVVVGCEVNGDGLTDIFDINGGGEIYLYVYKYNSNLYSINTARSINIGDAFAFGDFNGDRKTDFIVVEGPEYKNWILYQSVGLGLEKVMEKEFAIPDNSEIKGFKLYTGDFNGDGHSDILRSIDYKYIKNDNITRKIDNSLFFSNCQGNNFVNVSSNISSITDPSDKYQIIVSDYNGDSRSEIISVPEINNNPTNTTYYSLDRGRIKVKSIINGIGEETKIEYDFYEPNSDIANTYPVCNFKIPIEIVKSVKKDACNGAFYNTTYYFYNGKVHLEGKGFLGFEKVIISDEQKGLSTTVISSNLDNQYLFYKTITTTARTISNSIISNCNTITMNSINWGNKNIFVYPETNKIEEYDINGNFFRVKKSTANNYDNYGNAMHMEELAGNDETAFLFKKTINNTYDNYVTNGKWVLGMLKTSIITHHAPNTNDVINTTSNDYYTNGLLQKETVEPGCANSYSKTYIYDDDNGNYGNIIQTTTSAVGADDRISQYFYDHDLSNPIGRFLTKEIDPENHVIERTYEQSTGNMLTSKDVNGLITKYEYDEFDRLIKTTLPDGRILSTVLRWVNGQTDAPTNALYYSWSQTSGSSPTIKYYDKLNRKLREINIGFNGTKIFVDTYYDNKGRFFMVSEPYFEGITTDNIYYTKTFYDGLNRIEHILHPDGSTTYYSYDGLNISVTNSLGQISTKKYNAAGWLIQSTDANQHSVNYTYYSTGLVKDIMIDNLENTKIHKEYDIFGRTTLISDPDMGTVTSLYFATGELKSETTLNNNSTVSYTYDKIGRLKTRTETEGITTWNYDTQPNGIGKLASITGPNNAEVFTYDEFGRQTKSVETIAGQVFETSNTFDIYGRPKKLVYPSGFTVTQKYNQYGYLNKVLRDSDKKVLWEATVMNARGQYKQCVLGQVVTNEKTYNPETGLIESINAGNQLQNFEYDWDAIGNLEHRIDVRRSLDEHFLYDNLNRLRYVYKNDQLQSEMQYDILGNITYKTGVGTYEYNNPVKVHAVTAVNGNTGTISTLEQAITYTSFNKVNTITETAEGTSNVLQLIYGDDHERCKQIITKNGIETSKIYVGGIYEKIREGNVTKEVHYLAAGDGLFAIYTITKQDGSSDETRETNYVLTDHLGSIQILTNEDGSLKEEYSYDAWGNRRNPATWVLITGQSVFATDRGFTGHEQLDLFALVNMNGRVYDPVLGRFLSPDPVIQMPDFTQGLNRYSYCINNPLSFTDPSGHNIIPTLVSIVVAAVIIVASEGTMSPVAIGLVAGAAAGFAGSLTNVIINGSSEPFADIFFGTILGAMSGMINGDIGGLAENHGFLGEIARTAAHGLKGGVTAVIQGGKFEHGMYSAAFSSLGGSVAQPGDVISAACIGAVLGGTAEEIGGGKFANGAVTGAFTVLFNDFLHRDIDPNNVRQFIKTNFHDNLIDVRYVFSDGTTPPGAALNTETGEFFDSEGSFNAKVVSNCEGTLDMYIAPSVFKGSIFKLYLTAGHELVHVLNVRAGLYNRNFSENAAYSWELNATQKLKPMLPSNLYNKNIENCKWFLNQKYSTPNGEYLKYKNFGFHP